jgi:hypothetical protein
MSDLYDTDVVEWSERQADLLRRVAAGERINDQVDWGNVIEEIESVGNEERKAVASALMRGMQHKLYVLCWPQAQSVQHWRAEIRIHLADAFADFRASMREGIERAMPSIYRRACLLVARHMVDAGPALTPLPDACPWTLDELLAEGEAALR